MAHTHIHLEKPRRKDQKTKEEEEKKGFLQHVEITNAYGDSRRRSDDVKYTGDDIYVELFQTKDNDNIVTTTTRGKGFIVPAIEQASLAIIYCMCGWGCRVQISEVSKIDFNRSYKRRLKTLEPRGLRLP